MMKIRWLEYKIEKVSQEAAYKTEVENKKEN